MSRTLAISSTLWLCCLIAAVGLTASCGKKQSANAAAMMMMQAVPVRAVPAVAQDVPLDVSAVGNVEAMRSVDVKSQIAGQVLRVDFQEGQDVKQGELLFEIDPEPTIRQIAEIRADIAKDEALEQQAKANVAKDQATVKDARAQADRAVALAKEGVFSKEQTEQLVATADAAQAAVEADQAAVESAGASLNADRARLAQTQLQLTYTKIAAPIAGRAGAIAIKAGNLVKANDAALVTLLQMSPIYVGFGVPEQLLEDVRRYNSEHPLQVEAGASGEKTVTGTLRFIDNAVDTTTGTIRLKAAFDNADRTLWPGEFVNVQARLSLERNRITVPSRTLQTGSQGKFVWVINPADNTVAIRPVQVLRTYTPSQSTEEAVIGEGLRPGEMVITEGQMRLAPGAKVRLLKANTQLSGDTANAGG